MKKTLLSIFALLFLFFNSCVKTTNELLEKAGKHSGAGRSSVTALVSLSSLVDSMPPSTDNDSIERMTVLGAG